MNVLKWGKSYTWLKIFFYSLHQTNYTKKCETVVASVCGENNIFCFFFKITFICSSWQDVSVFKCLMVEILTWSDVEIYVWFGKNKWRKMKVSLILSLSENSLRLCKNHKLILIYLYLIYNMYHGKLTNVRYISFNLLLYRNLFWNSEKYSRSRNMDHA